MKLLLQAQHPSGDPQEVEIVKAGGAIYLIVTEDPTGATGSSAVRLTAVEAAQVCNGLREAFELDLEPDRKAPKYGVAR